MVAGMHPTSPHELPKTPLIVPNGCCLKDAAGTKGTYIFLLDEGYGWYWRKSSDITAGNGSDIGEGVYKNPSLGFYIGRIFCPADATKNRD